MNNNDDIRRNGFLGFVLRFIGIIAAVLSVGLVFSFSSGNTSMLIFTLVIALTFFLILMMRWDTYRRGAMFMLTAVCINIEHVSMFRTDYVFESIPEDDSSEPKIFILAEKRTKFKKYHQGVPYIMVFGMQKNNRELTSENLVTASKRVEIYDGQSMGGGYIDLDTLTDAGGSDSKVQDVAVDKHAAEATAAPKGQGASTKPKFTVVSTSEGEGDDS